MIRLSINRLIIYDQRNQQNAGKKLRTYIALKTNIKQKNKYIHLTKNRGKFYVNSEFNHTI